MTYIATEIEHGFLTNSDEFLGQMTFKDWKRLRPIWEAQINDGAYQVHPTFCTLAKDWSWALGNSGLPRRHAVSRETFWYDCSANARRGPGPPDRLPRYSRAVKVWRVCRRTYPRSRPRR